MVITNPEITKKISTPTNPPLTLEGKRWPAITSITAIARRPWISLL
jgi:hypothetical protein